MNRDKLLSWQELFNASRYFDRHVLTLTQEDLDRESFNAVPTDLDEKMARIQFYFDRLMIDDGGWSLITMEDQQTINIMYSIGDKNMDGKMSIDEFKNMMQTLGQAI